MKRVDMRDVSGRRIGAPDWGLRQLYSWLVTGAALALACGDDATGGGGSNNSNGGGGINSTAGGGMGGDAGGDAGAGGLNAGGGSGGIGGETVNPGATHVWSKGFGGAEFDQLEDIAVDPSGDVVVLGVFEGSADFGGGALVSADAWDIVLAKYDGSGNHLWSQRFGGAENQYARAVATDASGNIVIAGYFSGTVDFGGGLLTSTQIHDIYIAKLDPDGNHLWSMRLGGLGGHTAQDVAVDSLGNLIVTGSFSNTVDFGGGDLTSDGNGNADVFLAKYDGDGNHIWSEAFGSPSFDYGLGVAVDSTDEIVMTGSLSDGADLGGGPFAIVEDAGFFVAKYDSSGDHLWSHAFGDYTADLRSLAIATDGSGNAVIAGDFNGEVDFGGGTMTSTGFDPDGGGLYGDMFVVKFDSSGAYAWGRLIGGEGIERPEGVALDDSGNVALTGVLYGAADFGGGTLDSGDTGHVFVAKLDAGGGHVWSDDFGLAVSSGTSVACDPLSGVVVGGHFQKGSVDFGGPTLTNFGSRDAFLAKFSP